MTAHPRQKQQLAIRAVRFDGWAPVSATWRRSSIRSSYRPTVGASEVDLEKFAQDIFDSQPFSQFVGAELSKVGTDSAEITVPITDHLKQQHGYVHGGLISYVADNSITFAGGLALGGNALTSEFKINYLAPAVGRSLVGRAVAKGVGKRQAVCLCEVYAIDGERETLCAIAQGTVVSASRA